MRRAHRSLQVIAIVGIAVLLLSALDPLEGFPLVLIGGVLLVSGGWFSGSRWLVLLAFGLGLAAAGCGAMLWLSRLGGVGGTSGLPAAWGLTVLPYPIGAVLLLVGGVLLLRELYRSRETRPA
jgi:hypothetical protein